MAGERRSPALVLGPLGGGQTAPRAFAGVFGSASRVETLRSFVVRRLWRLARHAVIASRRASAVLCTNRETAVLARRMGARRIERVLDVTIPAGFAPDAAPERGGREGTLTLLWLGRIMPRKALPLAVMALERVPGYLRGAGGRGETEAAHGDGASPAIRLEIVGGGVDEETEAEFRAWLATRPGRDSVTMTGPVPFGEVGAAYERADVFVFPSLRESTGEPACWRRWRYGLPVVCLDHQGARELVTPMTPACASRSRTWRGRWTGWRGRSRRSPPTRSAVWRSERRAAARPAPAPGTSRPRPVLSHLRRGHARRRGEAGGRDAGQAGRRVRRRSVVGAPQGESGRGAGVS